MARTEWARKQCLLRLVLGVVGLQLAGAPSAGGWSALELPSVLESQSAVGLPLAELRLAVP